MKKYLSGLITGIALTTLIGSLIVGASAISSRMTIEVDPINVVVNGKVFEPKDVNGNPVAVFAYNGTTMAPLRALAEAYGLEVGYDQAANMATVTDPDVKTEQPTTPDTTANDELVVYNKDGKVLTGCEFDTCDVYINNVKLTSDTPVTVFKDLQTFFSFEKIVDAFALDVKLDLDLCDDSYVYLNGEYYLRPRDLLMQVPIQVDYDIETRTYKFH